MANSQSNEEEGRSPKNLQAAISESLIKWKIHCAFYLKVYLLSLRPSLAKLSIDHWLLNEVGLTTYILIIC